MASNLGLRDDKMAQLFEKFEVNREPRWKVISTLVGASFVLHLVLLWMVIYVPALRDTVNIVALVAGTKFVDKAYDQTQLAENVQWFQEVNSFLYPEATSIPMATSRLTARSWLNRERRQVCRWQS